MEKQILLVAMIAFGAACGPAATPAPTAEPTATAIIVTKIILGDTTVEVAPSEYWEAKYPDTTPVTGQDYYPTIVPSVEEAQPFVDFPIRLPGWLPPGRELVGIGVFPEGGPPVGPDVLLYYSGYRFPAGFRVAQESGEPFCCFDFEIEQYYIGYRTQGKKYSDLVFPAVSGRYKEIRLASGQTAVWGVVSTHNRLLWEDGDYVFVIWGIISQENAIKIAESF